MRSLYVKLLSGLAIQSIGNLLPSVFLASHRSGYDLIGYLIQALIYGPISCASKGTLKAFGPWAVLYPILVSDWSADLPVSHIGAILNLLTS